MTTRRLASTICFAAVAFLTTMQCADAARVYNYLNVPIGVFGTNGGFNLAPGGKSESLAWAETHVLTVADPSRNKTICGFNWRMHAELQGGNYLVVSMRGHQVSCVMCNAHHAVTHVAEGTLPTFMEPYTSPHHGC